MFRPTTILTSSRPKHFWECMFGSERKLLDCCDTDRSQVKVCFSRKRQLQVVWLLFIIST